MNTTKDLKSEKIRELLYEGYDEEVMKKLDVWYVSIVYVNGLNLVENDYAYFSSRGDAEQWFSNKRRYTLAYYAVVCYDKYYEKLDYLKERINEGL